MYRSYCDCTIAVIRLPIATASALPEPNSATLCETSASSSGSSAKLVSMAALSSANETAFCSNTSFWMTSIESMTSASPMHAAPELLYFAPP